MKRELERALLELIGRHSIASCKQLHEALPIKRSRRAVELALKRLEGMQIISPIKAGTKDYTYNYYGVRDSQRAVELASKVAGQFHAGFSRKRLRYSHYEHESYCFYVHESLLNSFPTIKIYREFEFQNADIPEHVLPKSMINLGEVPDMLVALPTANETKWIAIEVDRTRKQIDRVKRRIYNLATKLGIEGVLYFVPSEHFVEQYGRSHQEVSRQYLKLLDGAAQSFIAKSITLDAICDLKNAPVYCSDVIVKLEDWLHLISRTPLKKRDILLQTSFGIAKGA